MEKLETGKDKIKKISEILKNEALEPAKLEGEQLLEKAKSEAQKIVADAENKAHELIEVAKQKNKKDMALFEASLLDASKKGIEALRQTIESKLFNTALADWVETNLADPKVSAKLIDTIVAALKKEGTAADLSALIPQKIAAKEVNAHLAKTTLAKLKEHSVDLSDFIAGAQLKLLDKRLTLDLSDHALKELLSRYVRKDFRQLIFQQGKMN